MKQYQDLLKHVLTHGESHDDRTGVGTLSVFGHQIRFDLREGFPLLTTKKLPFRWIAEELFWFLRGSTNEHELEAVKVDIWKEWATPEQCAKFKRYPGDLGPVYGHLWRHFGAPYPGTAEYPAYRESARRGEDQIAKILDLITNEPQSRRILVSGWHPQQALQVALPPCHTLWQVKAHPNQYMSLHLYARSIDSFLGLPFNIASYALLLTLLAKVTGYEAKELVISFGDLHIYKNHISQVREQLDRIPKPLPMLEVNLREESQYAFWTPLIKLLAIKYEHLNLIAYDPHPAIKAEVAI